MGKRVPGLLILGTCVWMVSLLASSHAPTAKVSTASREGKSDLPNATVLTNAGWQSGMPYGAPDPIVGQLYFVQAKGKTFLQGAPEDEPCRDVAVVNFRPKPEDGPQFTHTLVRDLAVMETEVTRRMWNVLRESQPALPADPSTTERNVGGGPDNPVQHVSWSLAVFFANLLSKDRGLAPVYYTDEKMTNPVDTVQEASSQYIYMNPDASGFRLPTEGEWEYFARAGTVTPFWIEEPNYNANFPCGASREGDLPALESVAWIWANSEKLYRTSPVGLKPPNPWGLRDIHGNVFEACWDYYKLYPAGNQIDYQGAKSGLYRVQRGGSWQWGAPRARSANRYALPYGAGLYHSGFRLVRTVQTGEHPVRFAQFGSGQGFASDIVLVNPSPSKTVEGTWTPVSDDGQQVPSDSASADRAFSIAPLGVITLSSGSEGELQVGSAVAVSNGNLGGVVRFNIPGIGIAGVGTGEPVFGFITPVRRVPGGVNTGIALANVEDHPSRVVLTLRNPLGEQVAGGQWTIEGLPPRGHLALFINELFPTAAGGEFRGTLVAEAIGARVVATVLELGPKPGQFTTLPVAPLAQAEGADELFFAQFGTGQGFTSETVLVNPLADRGVSGTLSFFDNQGKPMVVGLVDSAPQTSVSFTLPPLGSVTIGTGGSGPLSVGSARVTADGPIGGVVRFSIPGVGIAGVGESHALTDFLIPVRRTADGLSTGIALQNAGASSVKVELTLRDTTGAPGGQVTIQDFAAHGHQALFLEELFPAVAAAQFEGTVSVRVTGGAVAATALELGPRPGEFTTLPVTAIE